MEVAEEGRLTLDPPLVVEDGSRRGRKANLGSAPGGRGRKANLGSAPGGRGRKANLGSAPGGRGWKSQRKEG